MLDLPECQFCELPSGQKLAWREWGTGRPLVLLHGWSMSSAVFSEVATSLAADFRVLCPDLPGHGQSDVMSGWRLSALAAAVEHWTERLQLSNIALLGWSLGGQVALQIAANGQLQVNKLLLVATTPRFCQSDDWAHGLPPTQIKALDRNLVRAYEKTMGDFFNLQFVGENLPKERYRQILKFAVRCSKLPQTEVARDALRLLSRADLRPQLTTVSQPTLIMHGEVDQIIPLAAGEYLASHLPSAQLYHLPNIGHAPFFSSPGECLTRWRKFLQ